MSSVDLKTNVCSLPYDQCKKRVCERAGGQRKRVSGAVAQYRVEVRPVGTRISQDARHYVRRTLTSPKHLQSWSPGIEGSVDGGRCRLSSRTHWRRGPIAQRGMLALSPLTLSELGVIAVEEKIKCQLKLERARQKTHGRVVVKLDARTTVQDVLDRGEDGKEDMKQAQKNPSLVQL
jgi:hypothetical protein